MIVRENFEHKDFRQGLWELWDTIGYLMNSESDDEKIFQMIDEVSAEIEKRYWNYIDSLVYEMEKKDCISESEFQECIKRIENMKINKIVDERALVELRKVEEIIY